MFYLISDKTKKCNIRTAYIIHYWGINGGTLVSAMCLFKTEQHLEHTF